MNNEQKLELTCSQCGMLMHFNRKCSFNRVKNNGCLCKQCRCKFNSKQYYEKKKQFQQQNFELTCSQCGEIMHFHRQCDFTRAKNHNGRCKKCRNLYVKKELSSIVCRVCGKEFIGKSTRKYCDECIKKSPLGKFRYDKNKGWVPQITKEEYNKKIQSGEIKNGMAGHSVYSVWLEKYGKEEADRRQKQLIDKKRESWNRLSDEEKKNQNAKKGSYGKNNPMYGCSFYDVWVKKYGKEEADRRMAEYKQKKSEHSKGKNNPMYGKSAPKGSGNGISGWYKGWYFRSLRELSYMINVIEKEGHEWRSLDNTKDFRIKYLDKNGHERSYCPDFLIDNKIVVEIKPKKLQELNLVVRKQNAATMYCKTRNLVHIITDVEILDFSIIERMVNDGVVRLTEKSLKKFNKYQHKHHKGECKNENQ